MPSWPAGEAYPISSTKIKDFVRGWQDILDILADAINRGHATLGNTNQGKHQNTAIYDDPAFLSLIDAGTGAPIGRYRVGIDGEKIAFQGRNAEDDGWDDLLAFNDATTGIATITGLLTCGWENLPETTRCVFNQATAPTGWSQVGDISDRLLRIVSGVGGGTGGAWEVTGLSTGLSGTAHHTHTVDGTTSVNSDTVKMKGIGNCGYTGEHSHAFGVWTSGEEIGGSGAEEHTHEIVSDSTWKLSYVDMVVASKDAAAAIALPASQI